MSVLELTGVGVEFRAPALLRRGPQRVVRALQEVSLSVQPGEAVGVVGANGAGKTTLLSVVAGGVPPSSGSVKASETPRPLIDLGGDLHAELTARDNVLYRLRRLGATKRAAQSLLDEVWDFAELDQTLLSRPLRALSAGSVLRLAFASSVALEPRLLLVDEVLAVGDLAFQVKCAARIQELRDAGMAILFASHNLEQVQATATAVIWLENGRVAAQGGAAEVLHRYRTSALRLQREPVLHRASIAVLGERVRSVEPGSRERLHLQLHEASGAVALRLSLLRDALGVLAVAEREIPNTESLRVELNVGVADGLYVLDLELLDAAGRIVSSLPGAVRYDVSRRTRNSGIVDLDVDVSVGV